MLYLIGGITKAGKSYVANKILKEKKIPVFQTDFLLWGLGSYDGEIKYTDSDEVNSKKLEDYIIKIASFLIQYDEDYVIEGTYVTIHLYKELKARYGDKVRCCFMGYPNADAIDKINQIIKYEKDIKNKWYKNLDNDSFISLINKKIIESKRLESECIQNHYIFFDSFDINKVTNDIISYLFN